MVAVTVMRVLLHVCVLRESVGTGGVLDVCLYVGCGGAGGVGGDWVGGLDQGLEGWCGVMPVRDVSPGVLCR